MGVKDGGLKKEVEVTVIVSYTFGEKDWRRRNIIEGTGTGRM